MAGIVKSTKRRFLIGKRIKEVEVPGMELDTDLFFADLTSVGGNRSPATMTSEFNALPAIVKTEAVFVIVRQGYKTSFIYGMNGDTKSLESFTFERNSSGTKWQNVSITLESANIPRIDTLGVGGYLFEKASSNLLSDSGFLNRLTELSTSGIVSAVDTGFSIGNLLDKGIKVAATSPYSTAYKSISLTGGVSYVFSCFVKREDGGSLDDADIRINIGGIILSPIIKESLSGGVYRIYATVTNENYALSTCGITKRSNSSAMAIICSGYQLEEGKYPTSYIPTTGAAVTRLADKLTSTRPIAIYPRNSFYIESDSYTGWFGNGVRGLDKPGLNIFTLDYFNANKYDSPTIGTIWQIDFNVLPNTGYSLSTNIPSVGVIYDVFFYLSGEAPSSNNNGVSSGNPRSINSNASSTICVGVRKSVDSSLQSGLYYIKLEKGNTATPAAEALVRIDAAGNLTVQSSGSERMRSLSLVPRAITQEEI